MQRIIIESDKDSSHYWWDLWRYRELFYFLAWRDFLARYKQTAVGVAWAILRPLLTTFVFTLVFSKLARLESGHTPYLLLVLAAQLPWQIFSNALSSCSGSLISNANLLTKVYFPRLLLPFSSLLLVLTDFIITLGLLALFMLFYQLAPSARLLTLPFWIFMAFLVATSAGIWIASLNVRYRDFGNIVPLVLQVGLYLSPVGYSTQIVPEKWRFLYSLNPVAGIIEGFRWALLGTPYYATPAAVILSWVLCLGLLVTGIRYFRHIENSFADTI